MAGIPRGSPLGKVLHGHRILQLRLQDTGIPGPWRGQWPLTQGPFQSVCSAVTLPGHSSASGRSIWGYKETPCC